MRHSSSSPVLRRPLLRRACCCSSLCYITQHDKPHSAARRLRRRDTGECRFAHACRAARGAAASGKIRTLVPKDRAFGRRQGVWLVVRINQPSCPLRFGSSRPAVLVARRVSVLIVRAAGAWPSCPRRTTPRFAPTTRARRRSRRPPSGSGSAAPPRRPRADIVARRHSSGRPSTRVRTAAHHTRMGSHEGVEKVKIRASR